MERITAEESEEERTGEERRVDSKVEVAEFRNGRNGERSCGHGGNRECLVSGHKWSTLQPTCSGALKSVRQLLGKTICRRESPHVRA